MGAAGAHAPAAPPFPMPLGKHTRTPVFIALIFQGPVTSTDTGAEVLEAVAQDLKNMGNDLDRQMSSEKSDVKNNDKMKSNHEPLKGN